MKVRALCAVFALAGIIGVSDNVMPGAIWERIRAVSDAFPAAHSSKARV